MSRLLVICQVERAVACVQHKEGEESLAFRLGLGCSFLHMSSILLMPVWAAGNKKRKERNTVTSSVNVTQTSKHMCAELLITFIQKLMESYHVSFSDWTPSPSSPTTSFSSIFRFVMQQKTCLCYAEGVQHGRVCVEAKHSVGRTQHTSLQPAASHCQLWPCWS